MPRVRFTDRSISALPAPATGQTDYFDERAPGFGIRVTERGHKSWIVMYRHSGRLRRLTLGPYPRLGLADARELAKRALADATRGEDPATRKKQDRLADTFAQLAQLYLDQHAKPKKRSWREDERLLNHDLLPRWRSVKVKDIDQGQVRRILDAIVQRGAAVTANRTLALVRKIFNFAVARGLAASNPCHGIERPTREMPRDRVLTPRELRQLWHAWSAEEPSVAALFKLQLLTAQRGGELRSMRWDHIDLETAWWTIPADGAKNGLAHRVPLSGSAMEILHTLRVSSDGSDWVFPSATATGPRATFQKPVRRIRAATGVQFRPHDLRRTAASHLTSMGVSRLTVAKLLNHVERGVTAIYDRHSYDMEKRAAVDAWALRLDEIVASHAAQSHPLASNAAAQATAEQAGSDHGTRGWE